MVCTDFHKKILFFKTRERTPCSTGKGKVKLPKGYIPTDPFPPLPIEAKAYVAVGRAKFKNVMGEECEITAGIREEII